MLGHGVAHPFADEEESTVAKRPAPAAKQPAARPAARRAPAARSKQRLMQPIPLDIPRLKCYGCSPENVYGLKLHFFRLGDEVIAEFTAAKHLQGWYGMIHGGIMCTLIDELAVWTVAGLRQRLGVTRDIQVQYKRPMYIGEPMKLKGQILEEKPALFKVRGQLINERGDICAEGDVTVFLLDEEQFARMIPGGQVPESLHEYFGPPKPPPRRR
jgi:uncharacterized protein (TIGR00369 family)